MSKNKQIIDRLRAASDAYYNNEQPLMTDSEFDKLREELKNLDPDNDFFNEIGAAVPSHRSEVDLFMHMGSQNKAKDVEDMKAWFDKYSPDCVLVSDKLDGSSMEAVYNDGKLTRVATRGNGKRGMDITKNAKLWKDLPHKLKVTGTVIIRGEAQLSASAWRTHFPDLANPRNGGNGITVCDSDYERNKHIIFHAFDLVHPEKEFETHVEKFKTLEDLGFKTARYSLCKSWAELETLRSKYEQERLSLDFEIDGIVVSINNLSIQESLGFAEGGSKPKGQIAWKFDTDKAETKVTEINLTLGHTGKVIPTATVEPVHLAGTTVTHCLLNNFDYIQELNLNVGDIVEIEKGGDIIPHINRVIHKNTSGPFLPPVDWKGYPLIKEGRDWKVVDEDCPDLNFQRIKNWISKTNIKQLGDTALTAMVDGGMVRDIDDLYTLNVNEVSELEVGNGKIGNNAKKISKEIDKTRSMDIDTFIGSLSVKHLGRSRAALLIGHGFATLDSYLKATEDSFIGLPCSAVGKYSPDVAVEIYKSLTIRMNLIERLSNHITINPIKEKVTGGKLSESSFCFSGVRMNKDQKEMFDSLGGMEKKSVSKDLTYLVLKDPTSTSSKAEKARKLDVKILSMSEFEDLLT